MINYGYVLNQEIVTIDLRSDGLESSTHTGRTKPVGFVKWQYVGDFC